MATETKYAKNEKVLCRHGLCIYPAKILDVDTSESIEACKYLVHYNGWKPKWNEWIQDDRLTKYSDEAAKSAEEENKRIIEQTKKKKLKSSKANGDSDRVSLASSTKEVGPAANSRGSSPSLDSVVSTSTVPASSTTSSKKGRKSMISTDQQQQQPPPQQIDVKRRKVPSANTLTSHAHGPTVQSEQEYLSKQEVYVKLPEELRQVLIDDWDLINKQSKLIRLPAKPTVAEIMNQYVDSKKSQKNLSPAKLLECVEAANGLTAFFDTCLGSQLLYKFEKPQFHDKVFKSKQEPSTLYGFPHFVRLFIQMGRQIAASSVDEKQTQRMLTDTADVLRFLKKSIPSNLSLLYELTSIDYQRLAYS